MLRLILIILCSLFLMISPTYAGTLDSPAAPSDDTGRMYTLEQIYDVAAGNETTWPTKQSGGFNEPATGPVATMHDLDDIQTMIAAGTTTATIADVDTGATFLTRTAGSGETLLTGTGHIVTGTGTGSEAAAGQIWTGYYAWGSTGSVIQGSAVSGDYGIPKTQQTTSQVNFDDGYYQKGYPTSGTHYTDNGDGTITDNATGLMWATDGNLIKTWDDAHDPDFDQDDVAGDGKVTWQHALDFVEGMNNGTYTNHGYTDWRLPNVKELQSIVNYGNWSPAIGESTVGGSGTGAPFTNTQSGNYWSSTTRAVTTTYAWYVYFNTGDVYPAVKATTYYYVRPVRAGQ